MPTFCRRLLAFCASSLLIFSLAVLAFVPAGAQSLVTSSTLSGGAYNVAVNPVTNKIWVTNPTNGTVTLIDGVQRSTSTAGVGTQPQALAINPITNETYVANFGSGTVTAVSGVDRSTKTATVGANPIALAVNPVTNKVYVANYGTSSMPGNTVTVIDPANANATSTVTVGNNPAALAIDPATGLVYVANAGSGTVTVINPANGNSTSTVTAGTTPSAIAVNPVTNKVYVANAGSASVTVIDGATRAASTVAVGTSPMAIAVNVATAKVYVANNGSANVTVIDPANGSAATTITLSGNPTAVAVDPIRNYTWVAVSAGSSTAGSFYRIDGNGVLAVKQITVNSTFYNPLSIAIDVVTNRLYGVSSTGTAANLGFIDQASNASVSVTAGMSPQAVAVNEASNEIFVASANGTSAGTVTVIDATNSNAVSNAMVGVNPVAIIANPVTNKVYTANQGSDSVTVVDPANANATTTISLPTGSAPQALAFSSVTGKVYVADYGTKQLSMIDTTNGNALTNIATGTNPRAVAVNPATNTIYVANYSDGTVTAVNGLTLATSLITVGTNPYAIGVNPVLNKVYVANYGSASATANVTIIDPTNANSTTAVGISNCTKPSSIGVNVNTSFVYTACLGGNELGVINAASSNSTSTSGSAGTGPQLLDINPLTNRIFVTDYTSTGGLSVVDGVSKSGSTASGLNLPAGVAVNSLTDKAYVAVSGATANNVLILTPQPDTIFPLAVAVAGTMDSNTLTNANLFQTTSTTPSFSITVTPQFTASTAYASLLPTNLTPTEIFYQVDGGAGIWTPVSGGTTANGSTTFVVTPATALTLGLHTLYAFATYGDSASESSSTGTGTAAVVSNTAGVQFVVSQPSSTTRVTAPSTTIASGSSQTYTATVAPAAASGTVVFSDTYAGATSTIGSVAVGSGAAMQAYTATGVGTHTITAVYSGDATYTGSTGTLVVQVNSPDATHTAVSVAGASTAYGTSITVSATVTDTVTAGTVPAGTVTFYDTAGGGTNSIGSAAVGGNGVASVPYTVAALGSNTFTATFTPTSANSFAASSDTGGQTVIVTAQKPVINWSPTSMHLAAGMPLGTGVLDATANTPGSFAYTAALSTGGAAQTVNTSTVLASGTYTVTASFTPTDTTDYQTATATITLTVANLTSTSTTLTATPTSASAGTAIAFTIAAAGSGGTPSGTVVLLDDGTMLTTLTLSGGTASYSTSALSIGSHTIIANYSGDTTFAGSTSSQAVAVTANTVQIALAASPALVPTGGAVALRASLSAATSTTAPTGSVTFFLGSTSLGTVAVSSNAATLSITTLPAGSDAITAMYSGDALYSKQTSSSQSVTVVTPVATISSVASSAASIVAGNSVTFTATLTPASTPTAPTGSFTFYDGTTIVGKVSLTGLSATYSTTALSAGSHIITAVYSGDTYFVASTSGMLTEMVAAPSLTLSAPAASVPVIRGLGGSTTITATPTGPISGIATFACGTLPAGGSCSFTPATLSFSQSVAAQSTVITFATNNTTALLSRPSFGSMQQGSHGSVYAALLFAPLGLIGLTVRRRGYRLSGRLLSLALAAALSMAAAALAGCGDSPASAALTTTPSGTYTIPVTATIGGVTTSTTFSVTVQ